MHHPIAQPTPLRFYLRKLKKPFACKFSTLYNQQIKQENIAWAAARSNLKKGSKGYQHTVSSDISHWVAYSFPLITDARKYKNVFNFFQMFSAMDDHADESWGEGAANAAATKKYWDKAIGLLETLRDEAPLRLKLLRNILMHMPQVPRYMRENFKALKIIMAELSATQRNRYINCFKTFMENASVQARMTGQEKYLTIGQYKEYRVKSIASMPCTLMIEYLYGIELTDAEYQHPALQQMEKAGTLQVAFINDIFSLFKEYQGSLENLNHAVSILVQNKKMTVQQAVDEICDEIERLQDEFINTRDEWYNSGEFISSDVKRFIAGFEHFLAGNAHWHRLSKRYHGESFNTVIESGIMEWAPDGTIYIPDEKDILVS